MTSLEVVIRKAGQADQTVPLRAGTMTLGRAELNEIVLADIGVSRKHAQLTVNPDGTVRVDDLGSGNGTWIRGKRLERPRMLEPGEILLIDPFTIELRRAVASKRYTPRSDQELVSAAARLDVLRGPNLAQGSYLVPGHGLSIGRSEYRDVVVLDPAASRHHCDVLQEDGEWWLRDRGSSNGVHINDERANDAHLKHGDVIRIGNTELRFVVLEGGRPIGAAEEERSLELSLPLPVSAVSATPESAALRAAAFSEEPTDPESTDNVITASRPPRRAGPWVSLGLGAVTIGLVCVAASLMVLAGVVAFSLRSQGVQLLPEPRPLPPAWTLSTSVQGTDVAALFAKGEDAMRQDRPEEALRTFHRILVIDPGNRAAERWSFAAGEHLMLDHMQARLDARAAERKASEAERDALLQRLPKQDAVHSLRHAFRDDPVVLTRMGWAPSKKEADLARQLDRAYTLANTGDTLTARDVFLDVLRESQNPAVIERARFGLRAARQELASQAAADWRLGVEAELARDLPAARAAYRRVLAIDQANPSAKARLGYLGSGPDDSAEARR